VLLRSFSFVPSPVEEIESDGDGFDDVESFWKVSEGGTEEVRDGRGRQLVTSWGGGGGEDQSERANPTVRGGGGEREREREKVRSMYVYMCVSCRWV
jgi:hypothetical protein